MIRWRILDVVKAIGDRPMTAFDVSTSLDVDLKRAYAYLRILRLAGIAVDAGAGTRSGLGNDGPPPRMWRLWLLKASD